MKRIAAILIVLVWALGAAGCDKQADDHKGHDHKPGEKH